MKPFNLEEAKAGKPICTRDGKNARIICFDRKAKDYPIIALIENNNIEGYHSYKLNGNFCDIDDDLDLFMKEEHHIGYINIYRPSNVKLVESGNYVYMTFKDAKKQMNPFRNYIATAKIEWDE
mgnify:CR=1 FL=1